MYVGQEFLLEYKYPTLGMIVITCFCFGPGTPILFPIGFFALLTTYIYTKYQLAYLCRKPISFNDKINKAFIRNCEILPILYSAFGFWVWSNRQIYENAV